MCHNVARQRQIAEEKEIDIEWRRTCFDWNQMSEKITSSGDDLMGDYATQGRRITCRRWGRDTLKRGEVDNVNASVPCQLGLWILKFEPEGGRCEKYNVDLRSQSIPITTQHYLETSSPPSSSSANSDSNSLMRNATRRALSISLTDRQRKLIAAVAGINLSFSPKGKNSSKNGRRKETKKMARECVKLGPVAAVCAQFRWKFLWESSERVCGEERGEGCRQRQRRFEFGAMVSEW